MKACGVSTDSHPDLHTVDLYTSHEALLLGYEEALTRVDSLSGDWYDCSAHMLWIGERTRQLDHAHVEILRGVRNPVGVKLGPSATVDEALGMCGTLNPDRLTGKLTPIPRMGKHKIDPCTPPRLRAVAHAGRPAARARDPLH